MESAKKGFLRQIPPPPHFSVSKNIISTFCKPITMTDLNNNTSQWSTVQLWAFLKHENITQETILWNDFWKRNMRADVVILKHLCILKLSTWSRFCPWKTRLIVYGIWNSAELSPPSLSSKTRLRRVTLYSSLWLFPPQPLIFKVALALDKRSNFSSKKIYLLNWKISSSSTLLRILLQK